MSNINVTCPKCNKINKIPNKQNYTKANCGKCKNSLLETKPTEATEASFSQFVGGSDLPVIVDFWAQWCGPCRMMAPAFEQAAAAFPLKAQFLKVNTEQEQSLPAKYNIKSLPTIVLFKNGAELDRVSGAMSSEQIIQWVKSKT